MHRHRRGERGDGRAAGAPRARASSRPARGPHDRRGRARHLLARRRCWAPSTWIVWALLDELFGRSLLAPDASRSAAAWRPAAFVYARAVLWLRSRRGPPGRGHRGRPRAARCAGRSGCAPTPGGAAHGGPAAHPQLLDHRPHRPRQVDAGRPHPGDDPHRRVARHARAGARLDGPRARARASRSRPPAVRVLFESRDGRHVPVPPHRHARPRRLHLRGQPLARRVRGRAAGRRRVAGRRGPDAGQHLPGDRQRASS